MLKRRQERHYSAHHMLIEVARIANERAQHNQPGWSYDAVTVMTFSALAVEAIANAFGDRFVEAWAHCESASPIVKLRLVADALGIPFNVAATPWSDVVWLISFRNLVAHAKPKLIKDEVVLTAEEMDRRLFDRPESKLERQITLVNAERAFSTARQIQDLLCQAIPLDKAMGLLTDGWSGFTGLHSMNDNA